MGNHNIDRLYYLTVLAEEQSVTRAAERLFVSQPALTAFVNRLEAELNVKLFERSTTPIRLTPAGRFYLSEMRRLEDDTNRVLDTVKSMGHQSTLLRMGIGRNRASLWLPLVLPDLYQAFPDTHLSISESRDITMVDQVAKGELDFAIIETFAYIGSLDYRPVVAEKRCLITGWDHPLFASFDHTGNDLFHPMDVPPEVVSQSRFLCPKVNGSLNSDTQWLFSSYGLAPKELLYLNSNLTSYQLAIKNVGVTFVAIRYADIVATPERPLFIMPGGKLAERKLYAVYHGALSEAASFILEKLDSVMEAYQTPSSFNG